MVVNTKEVAEKDMNVKRSSDEENRELSYKDEICVGCGICENICPVDAIELGDTGAIIRTDADVSKITIDEDKCVLCGMCSVACPADALDFKID
ncbi:MAG TPA: 4Fe-4S dicluster domain-containing protein, partial [Methanobacterium sp.]|nr:4Fe-4S dicluster domain-containing protein [Methanobacterium sp.]